MHRRILTALVAPAALLAGGCADLMQRSTIAPEWFQAKAIEVKGEGYPDFADVPVVRGPANDWSNWERDVESLRREAAAIESQRQASGAAPTDAEIRANAAQLRALLNAEADPDAASGEGETPPEAPEAP